MYRELLLGCGAKRVKDSRLPTAWAFGGHLDSEWPENKPSLFRNLTTLDINSDHKPDILWDLDLIGDSPAYKIPASGNVSCRQKCENAWYDEIHAYEVLEHIGQQGDYVKFFAQFAEFHRVLKPGGLFFATCPSWCSPWAWGDPSHTRVITSGTLVFLSQAEYAKQVGVTPMSDFRYIYKADFETVFCEEDNESLRFVLRAIK